MMNGYRFFEFTGLPVIKVRNLYCWLISDAASFKPTGRTRTQPGPLVITVNSCRRDIGRQGEFAVLPLQSEHPVVLKVFMDQAQRFNVQPGSGPI